MSRNASVLARWDAYMKAEGLKSTRQRRAIFDDFIAVEGHVSLDELLRIVQVNYPAVGYATVYRTMKLFVAARVAHERQFGDGQARFEPILDTEEHHDHVFCRNCGQIFEFEDEEIERRQARVVESLGLKMVRHRLDIWADCLHPESCERRQAARTAE